MPVLPAGIKELPRVFLGQGEVFGTCESMVIQTTLGSCVSVILHDPVSKFTAMSHSVMPEAPASDTEPLRYTDSSIEHLLALFAQERIPSGRIEAKLIGGASAPRRVTPSARYRPIGSKNVEVALGALGERGLNVVSRDTGGPFGRRVLLVTSTGEVFVRTLKRPGPGVE